MIVTKTDFLLELTRKLSPLPWEEIEDRWTFYSEMIDDRMDDGLSEDEAVAALGDVEEVAAQILADVPLSTVVKQTIKPKRRMKAWEIVLLILGFPVWFPVLLAIAAVALALYVCLWAVIVCLWAVPTSLAACALGGMFAAVVFITSGNTAAGLAMIAAALVCAGLAVFAFFGCKAASKGVVRLTKMILLGTKRRLMKKEGA